mgnify:CR=1 FL=1
METTLEHSRYHQLLRTLALTLALVLLFQSGLLSHTTARLSDNAQRYLANAVGVSVGVEPTELNQVTAALTKREQQLAAREEAVQQREIAVDLSSGGGIAADRTTYLLSAILFILLVLIVLNYVLDFVRARREPPSSLA